MFVASRGMADIWLGDTDMNKPTCSISNCHAIAICRGWCKKHYIRWYRHGDPEPADLRPKMTGYSPAERFWAKVRITNECWLWLAARFPEGYGLLAIKSRPYYAHRFAYELLVGPVPEGLHLDHLCRVRHCVNPQHLEPVTRRENILRGDSFSAANAKKTHCLRGHQLEGGNLHVYNGARVCRRCHRDRERIRRARRRGLI